MPFASSWMRRHSLRSRAPTPIGSKVWMILSTRSRLPLRSCGTKVGDLLERGGEVARIVEAPDDVLADLERLLVLRDEPELAHEIFGRSSASRRAPARRNPRGPPRSRSRPRSRSSTRSSRRTRRAPSSPLRSPRSRSRRSWPPAPRSCVSAGSSASAGSSSSASMSASSTSSRSGFWRTSCLSTCCSSRVGICRSLSACWSFGVITRRCCSPILSPIFISMAVPSCSYLESKRLTEIYFANVRVVGELVAPCPNARSSRRT